MSIQLFSQQLKEARRDALVANYIETQVPEELRDKINTADDLYEYLLLDTQISDVVKTSPLAEAISSLQLYIHRAMEGYDGPLADTAKQYLADEQFLFNWDDYNSRYSTWAGKERLKFYAGDYVIPELRNNQTRLFKEFNGRLTSGANILNGVRDGIVKYLIEYQGINDFHYISCCYSDVDSDFYIIAKSNMKPIRYYWKKMNASIKTAEWIPIEYDVKHSLNDIYNAYVLNGILYFSWLDEQLYQSESAESSPSKNIYLFTIKKSLDDTWGFVDKISTTNCSPYEKAKNDIKCPLGYPGFVWRTLKGCQVSYTDCMTM